MNSPLVSVIIPVYNVEKYVWDCLESVRLQTYNNIEVIIVNDESPDNSPEICEKFIENYNDQRFRLYSKPNGGLGDTRNFGVSKTSAKAEYVVFLDSDDELTPDCIESLIQFASHENLVIGKLYRCHKENREILNGDIKGTEYTDIWKDRTFLSKLKDGTINSSCGNCYSLRQIRHHSLKFEQELPEDTRFNIRYLSNIHDVTILSRPIYYYYIWRNSMSSSPEEIIFINYQKLQQDLYDKVSDENKKFIDQFVYPQYRTTAIKYIHQYQYDIPKSHLKSPLIKKAFSSYRPVSIGDFVAHNLLRIGWYKILRKI